MTFISVRRARLVVWRDIGHLARIRTASFGSACMEHTRPCSRRGRTSVVLASVAHHGPVLEEEDAGS
jgi:hypothetical protein